MFKLIERYYKMGIYSEADLNVFVCNGDITAAQAEEIITAAKEKK